MFVFKIFRKKMFFWKFRVKNLWISVSPNPSGGWGVADLQIPSYMFFERGNYPWRKVPVRNKLTFSHITISVCPFCLAQSIEDFFDILSPSQSTPNPYKNWTHDKFPWVAAIMSVLKSCCALWLASTPFSIQYFKQRKSP